MQRTLDKIYRTVEKVTADISGVQYLKETLGEFLPDEVAENLKTIIDSVESTKSAGTSEWHLTRP